MTPLTRAFSLLLLSAAVAHAEPPRLDRYGDPLPDGALVRLGSKRLRHNGGVWCVLFTPDGRTIFSTGPYDTVRCWDANTGAEKGFPGNSLGRGRSLAVLRDGKILAVACDGEYVSLHDTSTGRGLGQIPPAGVHMAKLCSTPDGKTLIMTGPTSRGLDAEAAAVRVLDLDTRTDRFVISVERTGSVHVDLSPDGRTLAATGHDGIKIWDIKERREIRHLRTTKSPSLVRFAPDGKTLVFEEDSYLRLWDVTTQTPKREEIRIDRVHALAFSPDGTVLACAEDRDIVFRDPSNLAELRRLSGHRNTVSSIKFGPDGKTLASGDYGGAVRIWDVASAKQKLNTDEPSGRPFLAQFTPDGQHAIVGTGNEALRVWNADTGAPIRRVGYDDFLTGDVQTVVISPDGKIAAAVLESHSIDLWDLATGEVLHRLKASQHVPLSIAFMPDGKTLFSAGYGDSVLRWNVATGRRERDYGPVAWRDVNISLTSDGSLMAATGPDGAFRLFDPINGRERGVIWPENCRFTEAVLLSPDGRLVAMSHHAVTELWEVASGTRFYIREPLVEMPSSLAFSPDSRKLALACDRGLRIVDVLSQETTAIDVERLHVSRMAFSPDGRRLLTAEDNGTALIWDLARFKPVELQARLSGGLDPRFPKRWDRLTASAPVEDARRTIASSVAAPNVAVPFLAERLRPIPHVDVATIRRLIHDLNSEDFDIRERASGKLEQVVDAAESELRAVVENTRSAEVRRQARLLLQNTASWQYPMSGEALRTVRAIEVLERIATPEARKLLRDLAKGAPGARQTREAAAALKRLEGG
jgi:WD40 repeat protein